MKLASGRIRPVILCVDDDEQLLETIEFLLVRNFPSYRVIACVGGQDALEQLADCRSREWDVHLVLSDQVMDEVSGLDLLAKVPDAYPDAVRIILTGQSGLSSAIEAIKLGIDDYLEKPLSEIELVKTLRNHLNNVLLRQDNRRLQELIRRSHHRTSAITDLAFGKFNTQLTRLLSGEGDRAEVIEQIRRARRDIQLLSHIYKLQNAMEGGTGLATFSPQEIVSEALRGIRTQEGGGLPARRNLDIKLVNYEDGESITSNRVAIRVVLERLLENACQQSPEGSTLTITIRGPRFYATPDRSAPTLLADLPELLRRGYFIFTVRDEGRPGDEDTDQLKLLQSWDAGLDLPLKGLGLIIAQEYTQLTGGELIFDLEAGRVGTEVHAAFPISLRVTP